jgi:hypothetical protein
MRLKYKREGLLQFLNDAHYNVEQMIDYNRIDVHSGDLHHELFNTGDGFIYYGEAAKWISDTYVSVFEAIGDIVEYEKSHFGEVHTDLSCPIQVANMLNYIMGYELLYEDIDIQFETEFVTIEALKELLEEIESMIAELEE